MAVSNTADLTSVNQKFGLSFRISAREKVRTTKITTSKTKKISENSVDDQNIEKNN
jgi:hypothetical protein